jgi:ketosteroid isomerase-like protein
VEVVRRVYEAAARRDPATVLALYDPEVELDPSRLQAVGLFDRVYHGHDGLRSFFREWHEAWEGIEYDYDELIDAGERVISVVTRHGRGRASGAEVELALGTRVDDPQGQGHPGGVVPDPRRCPRSRRAVGVVALDCRLEGSMERSAFRIAPPSRANEQRSLSRKRAALAALPDAAACGPYW